MKIIFLDIDGVLNSRTSIMCNGVMDELTSKEALVHRRDGDHLAAKLDYEVERLDHTQVNCLRYILEKVPDARIVVHSTWRSYFSLERLKEILAGYCVDPDKIIGVTTSRLASQKCEDIAGWLRDYKEAHGPHLEYVIIENTNIDPDNWFEGHMILVDDDYGLSYRSTMKAIKVLDPEFKEQEILL